MQRGSRASFPTPTWVWCSLRESGCRSAGGCGRASKSSSAAAARYMPMSVRSAHSLLGYTMRCHILLVLLPCTLAAACGDDDETAAGESAALNDVLNADLTIGGTDEQGA